MKIDYLLLVFILFLVFSNCKTTDKYKISNPEKIVESIDLLYEMTSKNKQYYFRGKIEIISGVNHSLVARMDSNNDNEWDSYFGVFSEVKQNLNEKIEDGEIIFLDKLVIINSTTDKRRYLFKLNSDKTSDQLESKLPVHIKRSINKTIRGYGIHSHKGDNYNVKEFIS